MYGKYSVVCAYRTAKSVDEAMNHDPPADKLMMAVDVPESVWALHIVFAPPLYLAVSEDLTNMVDSAKGLKNPTKLYTMTVCSQMTHHVA